VRFARARRDVEALQEMLADQMRRLAFRRPDAQVDAGLAKVDGMSCACVSVMCSRLTLPNGRTES
jgi:hypothetical protein